MHLTYRAKSEVSLGITSVSIRKTVCSTCGELISRGGTNAKNFNTTNLRYRLQRVHIAKFEELELKQQEETDKKAEEFEVKQQKLMHTNLR